ncbi:hypothetical protein AVEN_107774-1 [Araneus ventricosus]|uniref:Uncharacterized protein n=1 Tax=Araneus ventricosus TaxID=182803 RepID=A0A4Y2QPS6_ARAVE|nr:hypothetical protein AVEN_271624-1 [Araneus ventricosus]GBN68395.1 hypothetical protein AVEN_107774-1 [Araneus ventricosus]
MPFHLPQHCFSPYPFKTKNHAHHSTVAPKCDTLTAELDVSKCACGKGEAIFSPQLLFDLLFLPPLQGFQICYSLPSKQGPDPVKLLMHRLPTRTVGFPLVWKSDFY